MDMDMYKDGEIHRHHYYGSEDSPLEDLSPYRITKLSHLLQPTAIVNSTLNVFTTDDSGTYDEYETFFEDNELSSLLRLAGRSQYILPSTSSSVSSSSSLFSPISCSRSPFSDSVHSPPVKMEFNEDVLVMDGILLNQMSSSRSSRSSLFSGSSSCSSSGANYCNFGCGVICKCPFLHHRTQNKPPFVVYGRKKGGRVPDGRVQTPKESVTSRGDFDEAEGTVVSSSHGRNNTSAGASECDVPTPCKISGVSGDAPSFTVDSSSARSCGCTSTTMESKNHTKKGEDSDAISKLNNGDGSRFDGMEPIVALENEISKKGKEVVLTENIPKRGKRLPIFEEIAPS